MSAKPTLLFKAVGVLAAIFVLTVFVMIAALFSDPELPINLWLNRYSLSLLLGEVLLMMAFGLAAMIFDRPAETPNLASSDE